MSRYRITHPGTGHVDRVEVRDGAVSYATPGVWIVQRMPWVQAADILRGMGCTIDVVDHGQPWPEEARR